jgi:drug/metabolite transporter (DMT)-like permease
LFLFSKFRMDSFKKALINLHIAVFLFGFTGILGKLILLPALILVWWRALLTWVLMLPGMLGKNGFKIIDRKSFIIFMLIGVLVALHWLCFYGSIKLANSSIGMICLAFIPIFTAFFDSFINKSRLQPLDIFIGFLCLPGMWLILQNIELSYQIGFFVGILSALFSAWFATLNKKYIHLTHPSNITWIELFSVWMFLSIILPFNVYTDPELQFWPKAWDWFYLIILSVICTYIAYTLAIKSLKELSAFSVMLTFNLEPVYGIIVAILLLKEHKELNTQFYLGVSLILLSVFLHPVLKNKMEKRALNI